MEYTRDKGFFVKNILCVQQAGIDRLLSMACVFFRSTKNSKDERRLYFGSYSQPNVLDSLLFKDSDLAGF